MTISSIITFAAKAAGISPSLLFAICMVESNLQPRNNFKDRYHSSYGLAQLQLPTAREVIPYIDALALQQPQVNLYIAARVLKKKLDLYGPYFGIAAYNSGSPKFRNNKLINLNYLDKVLFVLYNKLDEEIQKAR
jgi:soluble lytic murein transglycosylase-like protein